MAVDASGGGAKRRWIPFEQLYGPGVRVRLRSGKLYHFYYRQAVRRYNQKLRNAKPTIGRAREAQFVVAFARRMSAIAMSGRGKIQNKEIREAAAAAAADAGYQVGLVRKGGQLLRLPRIQAALDGAFATAKMSLEETAAELAGIIKNHKVDVHARIRAIELRFRVTTGFATTPVVGKFEHTHTGGDALFDEHAMRQAPPIEAVDIEGGSNGDQLPALQGDSEAARSGPLGKKRPRSRGRGQAA